MRISSFKTTFFNIKNVVFNHYHLNLLLQTTLLEIWEKYSNHYQEHFKIYLNNTYGCIDDKMEEIIEFLAIRLIYLSLNLDEFSVFKDYTLSHININMYVFGGWYDERMGWIEREMMDYCNWNPIRFCKEMIGDTLIEKESPLFSKPI
jgi:hypothetical protein